MDATPRTRDESAALTRRVTALSVATAGLLVVLKAIVWLASDSVAILASMADSGLDLIASGATFFAVRYAAAPPDAEHRFGHGKAEAFASLIQAGLVFASAALIGQEAIRHLINPGRVHNEIWGIAVMAGLDRPDRRPDRGPDLAAAAHALRRRIGRPHALCGRSGLQRHRPGRRRRGRRCSASAILDAVAGLAVGAILLWGAVSVFRGSSSQLMDHELSDAARARIVALVTEDPRITDVHQLRTRAAGPVIHLQMHADLDPELSLVAAHQAVVAAEKRILREFPEADILIHPDPRGRAEPHGGAFAEVYEAHPHGPPDAA